jgi:PAS domain S-box-containing protein
VIQYGAGASPAKSIPARSLPSLKLRANSPAFLPKPFVYPARTCPHAACKPSLDRFSPLVYLKDITAQPIFLPCGEIQLGLKPAGAFVLVAAALGLGGMAVARSADQSSFMPHGYCYLWNTNIVLLHVISDGLIALSYFCIPIALIYLVRKRGDLPFNWIFWMFGAFIVSCGVTHFMDIWTIWHASYLLSGVIKAATAGISVLTAIMMIPLIPKAIALPSSGQLHLVNRELQVHIVERALTEQQLRSTLRERELALAQLADRQSAVEELQKAQESLREQVALLDLAPVAIVSRDMENRVTFWNRGAEELYELDRSEALGQVLHLFSQGGSPVALSNLEAEIQKASTAVVERTHCKRNGECIMVGSRWSLRTNAEGLATGYLEITGDITERKRAEEASERLAAVVESSNDAIISKNLQGVITAWNPSAEKLFGYSAAEVIGRPMLGLFPPDRILEEKDLLSRIARGESIQHYETVRIRKNLSSVNVEATISPIRDRLGKIVGASKIARDMTERKHSQEAGAKSLP